GLVLNAPASEAGDRWLKSNLPDQICYCGVDWSRVPAWSHKPFHVGSNPTPATSFALVVYRPGFLILDQKTRIRLPPRVRGCGGAGVLACLSRRRTRVRGPSAPPCLYGGR